MVGQLVEPAQLAVGPEPGPARLEVFEPGPGLLGQVGGSAEHEDARRAPHGGERGVGPRGRGVDELHQLPPVTGGGGGGGAGGDVAGGVGAGGAVATGAGAGAAVAGGGAAAGGAVATGTGAGVTAPGEAAPGATYGGAVAGVTVPPGGVA